jgi:type IV pilus assembly protein PilA
MTPGYPPQGPYGQYPGYPQQPPPKKKSNTLLVVLLVAGGVVLVLPILSVFAIFGVRKYLVNAKSAEARNTVAQIAKSAVDAYDAGDPLTGRHRICSSATLPVPTLRASVRGVKYQSAPSDWEVDRRFGGGFSCLKFSMSFPQYYQYEYRRTSTGFVARAHGDLDGDGIVSTFEIEGIELAGAITLGPLREIDPTE